MTALFTVIIAEKDYIDKIKEYELFLGPLVKDGGITFAEWNTEGERFQEMLPTIGEQVGRREEWRTVIICNEDGLYQQNPFDLVDYKPGTFTGIIRGEAKDQEGTSASSEDGYSDEYKEFLVGEQQKKLQAYEDASKNPLTRLVTFLCDAPMVTFKKEGFDTNDLEYGYYLEASEKKKTLRDQIIGNEQMEISQPKEIYCVAKRTYSASEEEYETVWSVHTETEYSRFYDRNMYFDRMRYLLFDIKPIQQKDYPFDYLRFLYSTLLLASHGVPNGCLAAERVYNLECKHNLDELRALLDGYDAKLKLTQDSINRKIRELHEKEPIELSDNEAYRMINTRIEQTVTFDESVSSAELYVNSGQIGLSNGCPRNEEAVWEEEYKRSRRMLQKMLKQSKRALKRATNMAWAQQEVPLESAMQLDEFQLEDIQEYVDAQELSMTQMDIVDVYSEQEMFGQMEQGDKEVKEMIKRRMDRRTTLILGGIACGLYLISFFTMFFKNSGTNVLNLTSSLTILGIVFAVFVLVAIGTLLILRKELTRKFRDYNDTMKDLDNKLHESLTLYSIYLTHACNIRRGYGVLNTVEENIDPNLKKEYIYKKHVLDIERVRENIRSIFGQLLVDYKPAIQANITEYEHNYNQPIDYEYPLPQTEGAMYKITYLQQGNHVYIPVGYIKEIIVRREELYE